MLEKALTQSVGAPLTVEGERLAQGVWPVMLTPYGDVLRALIADFDEEPPR